MYSGSVFRRQFASGVHDQDERQACDERVRRGTDRYSRGSRRFASAPACTSARRRERGLHHLVYEVVDNSIDEALAGYADAIDVIIHADNSITVDDNGRGIPVDIHPTEKIPGVELAMTVLHAGGKFDKDSYKVSGGLHGVGVSVVNALSEQLKVWVKRDGKEHYMDFVRGDTHDEAQGARRSAEEARRARRSGSSPTTRSSPSSIYDYDTLAIAAARAVVPEQGRDDHAQGRARRPGERRRPSTPRAACKEIVQHLNAQRKALHTEVVYIETERDDIGIELALQYNDGYNENVFSFVNNINTHEGGTHLTGFKSALTRVDQRVRAEGRRRSRRRTSRSPATTCAKD